MSGMSVAAAAAAETATTSSDVFGTDTTTTPWIPLLPPRFRWECVFMVDNGAFFVNYVITSAFIGLALALIRIPELLWYGLSMMTLRSEAERMRARKVG